ncbi:MAG: hypothetical protein NUV50_00390 [Rhodospirillales bacterium]|nr:hypothetical protein [Rhodospirillales bacterium]
MSKKDHDILDDGEHQKWWDYYARLDELEAQIIAREKELCGLNAAQELGPEYNTKEHLSRMKELREDIAKLRNEKMAAELKSQKCTKPTFSAEILKAYKERIKNWPKDQKHPSEIDDCAWGKENYELNRERIRKLRRDHAPEKWTKKGRPKKTRQN